MNLADEDFLSRLNQLTDQHLAQPDYGADELGRDLGVSRSFLFRMVKQQTGLTVGNYIRMRRLQRARELLLTSSLRIAEVAEVVGFSSPQYFTRYFTEEFGTTPSALRRTKTPETSPTQVPSAEEPLTPQLTPETAPAQTPADTPARQRAARKQPVSRLLLGGVFVLALLGGLVTYRLGRGSAAPAAKLSLVVLPLKNIGRDQTDPLADGITDELRGALALAPNLTVIAPTSANTYKNTDKTVWQIGDELGVTHLLRGSIFRQGPGLQINLELLRTRDNIRVWSKTYRGAYNDLFATTNRLSQDVLDQLQPTTALPAITNQQRPPTTSLPAYNAFLLGRQLMLSRSEAKLRASLDRFDEALALDNRFVDAYTYKAISYGIMADMGYPGREQHRALMEQNAHLALGLDSTNSTANAALGVLYANTYQWPKAQQAFQKALRYNPNDAQANYWYSLLLRSVGQVEQALPYSQKAITLDPLYPVMMTGHVFNCVYAGKFGQARQLLMSSKPIFDDSFLYYFAEALYHLARQDFGRAAQAYHQVLRLNPAMTSQVPSLLYCEARMGQTGRARAYLAKTPDTPQDCYNKAVVSAGLGNETACLTYLRRAADGGFIYKDMLVFPVFKPYRNHPVFRAILRQYHLPTTRQ